MENPLVLPRNMIMFTGMEVCNVKKAFDGEGLCIERKMNVSDSGPASRHHSGCQPCFPGPSPPNAGELDRGQGDGQRFLIPDDRLGIGQHPSRRFRRCPRDGRHLFDHRCEGVLTTGKRLENIKLELLPPAIQTHWESPSNPKFAPNPPFVYHSLGSISVTLENRRRNKKNKKKKKKPKKKRKKKKNKKKKKKKKKKIKKKKKKKK